MACTVPLHLRASLDLPIDCLALSVRAYNGLANRRVDQVGQIVRISDADLRRFPFLGAKSCREIRTALARFGLHVGTDVGRLDAVGSVGEDLGGPDDRRRRGTIAAMSTSTLCPVCKSNQLSTPEDRLRRACEGCARELGLYPFAAPQRPAGPCRRCSGPQIVRARIPEGFAVDGTTDAWLRPLALTYTHRRGALGVEHVTDGGVGFLEAYVCRRCGFTEIYCTEPDALPIGPQHGTELLEYASSGPLR